MAQPADASGSPRWDYVLKRAIGAERNLESRRQIERFALAASATAHPNLIAVLDASTAASPYIVMPRLEGSTLNVALNGVGSAALPVVLWWIRQVAQSLAALHAAGWVHQDLKPENVIIGSRGHATLIDLGFAARAGESVEPAFRGTPKYAAPEAIAVQGFVQTASDIFSLGRLLWFSITQVRSANDRMLEPVAELIERLVAEDPKQRPDANWICRQLLRLEIESLGRHIGPGEGVRRAA